MSMSRGESFNRPYSCEGKYYNVSYEGWVKRWLYTLRYYSPPVKSRSISGKSPFFSLFCFILVFFLFIIVINIRIRYFCSSSSHVQLCQVFCGLSVSVSIFDFHREFLSLFLLLWCLLTWPDVLLCLSYACTYFYDSLYILTCYWCVEDDSKMIFIGWVMTRWWF